MKLLYPPLVLIAALLGGRFSSAEMLRLEPSYLQRLDKKSEMIALDYKEPITLLSLWKADCPHCRDSVRDAEKAFAELHLEGLRVYALYSDVWSYYDDRAKIQISTPLPQLHDAGIRLNAKLGMLPPGTWVAISQGGDLFAKATTPEERQSLLSAIREKLRFAKNKKD